MGDLHRSAASLGQLPTYCRTLFEFKRCLMMSKGFHLFPRLIPSLLLLISIQLLMDSMASGPQLTMACHRQRERSVKAAESCGLLSDDDWAWVETG